MRNAVSRQAGLAVAVILSAIIGIWAQTPLQFKAGDKVEGKSSYSSVSATGWGQGTIMQTETNGNHKGPYLVHFDGKDASFDEWLYVASVRALGGAPAFKVGDRVDVFYAGSGEGKGHATVLEVQNGSYKVHYDGCKAYFDEVVDRGIVRPFSTLAPGSLEVKFLVGAWAMFTPSYPNTVVRGTDVFREYGPGAKSPPLQINADGTYVWNFDFGKEPVKGKWETDAKMPGAKMGTGVDDGILIKDPSGQPWKVHRWTTADKTIDRIEARLMCSGETMIGSRIR
jgi:hypothetical protein